MPRKEPIELRSQQERDRFNDPVGPAPEWRQVPGAIVVPRNSQDYEQRGPVIVSGFMVVVGPKVEVDASDEVRVRGKVHQIEGEIGDYGSRKIFYTERAN